MGNTILVTGGAGFVGSHIVDAFFQAGHDVVIIDNLSTGRLENVHPAARFYPADICDAAQIDAIFEQEKPAAVCHQAALANVRSSVEQPARYAETNIIGSLHVLDACRKHDVGKLIFASTGGAIYGEVPYGSAAEDFEAHPLDPYGVSKLAVEHYLYAYRHNYGLEYCALRYSNVYGTRQNAGGEGGVVAIFVARMLSGQPAIINGSGTQTRDFVYVGDVAQANLRALSCGSGIYNIGTGIATDVNRLFRDLAQITQYQLPELHGPAKPGEVRSSCVDANKARRELEWVPTVTLQEGLARTVDYFRSGQRG